MRALVAQLGAVIVPTVIQVAIDAEVESVLLAGAKAIYSLLALASFSPVTEPSASLAVVMPASSASFEVAIAAEASMLALSRLPLISLIMVVIGVL